MKVTVALDPEYGARPEARPGPAFWLVESAPNRALAERLRQTAECDPNSAVFQADRFTSTAEAALSIFLSVAEHHPDCREVEFIGATADDAMRQAFAEIGISLRPLADGFTASPARRS